MGKAANKRDISFKLFVALIVLFAAAKLFLCAFQMIHIYSPGSAPIDDELMLRAARSIGEGRWLGDYDWLTLSKNMFFAVWLWLLNTLHIPYLIGNQLLCLFACLLTSLAFKPVFKARLARLLMFTVLWFSPFSWAQFTLRIYRDSILPWLALIFFSGLIGLCLRFDKPFKKQLPFAVASGIGLGLSLLTREDAIWLLPFACCAALVYVVARLIKKLPLVKTLAAPALAAALCLSLIASYSALNLKYYGRFITNDFNSSDFTSALAAMQRADTDIPHDHVLVCRETRLELYEISPSLKKLEPLLETKQNYQSYGYPEKQEFQSAGMFWPIRKAAYDAGLATTALDAKEYYETVAKEINDACDNGLIDAFDAPPSLSVYILPYDSSFFAPVMKEVKNAMKLYFFYEQTSPLAPLSYSTAEQAEVWEQYTHTASSRIAEYGTAEPHYSRAQKAVALLMEGITWIYRILTPFAIAFALLMLIKNLKALFKRPLSDAVNVKSVCGIMLLGVLLSFLLRTGAVAYIHALTFEFPTFLLYYSASAALFVLLAACGAAHAFQLKLFGGNDVCDS